jgi:hypothetical protein
MGGDGAIHVRRGDVLSKYAAAISGTPLALSQFARLNTAGCLVPIANVNRIYAGETIYHAPTYLATHAGCRQGGTSSDREADEYSEEDVRAIMSFLRGDFDVRDGELLEVLDKIQLNLKDFLNVYEFAETAEFIAEGSRLVKIGSVAGGIIEAFEPILAALQVLKADDTDRKIAGLQAIGYATTAWAFGDPPPKYPGQLRRSDAAGFPGTAFLSRQEHAWEETTRAAMHNLQAKLPKTKHYELTWHGRTPELVLRDPTAEPGKMKLYWQALGSFDRSTLVRRIMQAVDERWELKGNEKLGFWSLDPTRYPH